MIDFAKITKTLDGYDCHYFGVRVGYDGTKLHCFAIMTSCGVVEKNYDEQGRRLEFRNDGKWQACEHDSFAIIKPPKIVEVTRWIALHKSNVTSDGYTVSCFKDEPIQQPDMLNNKIQHTFRFEVPND